MILSIYFCSGTSIYTFGPRLIFLNKITAPWGVSVNTIDSSPYVWSVRVIINLLYAFRIRDCDEIFFFVFSFTTCPLQHEGIVILNLLHITERIAYRTRRWPVCTNKSYFMDIIGRPSYFHSRHFSKARRCKTNAKSPHHRKFSQTSALYTNDPFVLTECQ